MLHGNSKLEGQELQRNKGNIWLYPSLLKVISSFLYHVEHLPWLQCLPIKVVTVSFFPDVQVLYMRNAVVLKKKA